MKILKRTLAVKADNVEQKSKPSWYNDINNDLKEISTKIFNLWSVYGKTSQVVNTNKTTKIHIDGIFFIPGGRFNELYILGFVVDSDWSVRK